MAPADTPGRFAQHRARELAREDRRPCAHCGAPVPVFERVCIACTVRGALANAAAHPLPRA